MRPVERGPIPIDSAGKPKDFAEYGDARSDLYERIGRYCSFCERTIKAGMHVEHVLPKSIYPLLEKSWANFLLACGNCNSTKSSKNVDREHIFLPDQDNTFLVLKYSEGGQAEAADSLNSSDVMKANSLIQLVGLDKSPKRDPKASDMRWNDRRESWDKATRLLRKYENGQTDIEGIIELSKTDGHWSIWMTVFAGIRSVRLALLESKSIPGTAPCFDEDGLPIPR